MRAPARVGLARAHGPRRFPKTAEATSGTVLRVVRAAGVLGLSLLLVVCHRDTTTTEISLLERAREDRRFLLGSGSAGPATVYVDLSASMRGFALATARDEASGEAGLLALLTEIGDLVRASSGGQPPGSDQEAAWSVFRGFGAGIQALPPDFSLADAFGGRQATTWPGSTSSSAASQDCQGIWRGRADRRSNINSTFSQLSSCLPNVFNESARSPRNTSIFVLTDAEQLGTPGDARCDATKGFGDIQSAIATLLDERHYVGGVLHASLPYQPWWASEITGSRDRYCACDRRSLFLYLLSPSAEFAGGAVRALQSRFASEVGQGLGNQTDPAGRHPGVSYFPLVPPPGDEVRALDAAVIRGGCFCCRSGATERPRKGPASCRDCGTEWGN